MTQIVQSTTPESAGTIRDFLNSHHAGTLATANTGGAPHGATVYYTLEDIFSLLFGTKSETQKYKNIEENNQVAFVVSDEASQTTVQIQGRAEIIIDEDEKNKAVDAMYSDSAEISHRAMPPAEKLFAGDQAAVRIIPQTIKMAIYARPDSEGDDLYETLVFDESAS